MRIPREYETPLLLGLACALLAVLVSAEWLWKTASQRSVQAKISGDAGGAAVPEQNAMPKAFELPPLEHFSGIVERPLFIQGRRPLAPVEEGPVEPEKSFDAQLHGIVMAPDGSMLALLKNKAGRHYKLRVGEKLDGWELAEIAPDRVMMMRGESKRELLLQKPKPKEPAKAEAPAEAPAEEAAGEESQVENRQPRIQVDKRR